MLSLIITLIMLGLNDVHITSRVRHFRIGLGGGGEGVSEAAGQAKICQEAKKKLTFLEPL